MIKPKVAFWRAGFYPTNQSNLKSFQKALIGWKKAGLPKKPLLLRSCVQANNVSIIPWFIWDIKGEKRKIKIKSSLCSLNSLVIIPLRMSLLSGAHIHSLCQGPHFKFAAI